MHARMCATRSNSERTKENIISLVRLLGAGNFCHVPPAALALSPLDLHCLYTTHVSIAVVDEFLRQDAVDTRVLA